MPFGEAPADGSDADVLALLLACPVGAVGGAPVLVLAKIPGWGEVVIPLAALIPRRPAARKVRRRSDGQLELGLGPSPPNC